MKLRTKTQDKFTGTEVKEVINFISLFCNSSEEFALELLEWATYNPTTFLKVNKWNVPVSSPEQLSCLIGDLKLNYNEQHPNCWFLKKNEFPEELRNVFGNNWMVLNSLSNICRKTLSSISTEEFERIIFLISSNVEKNVFGGLRALGATPDQANYIKKGNMQIVNYLKSFPLDELKKVEEEKNVHNADASPAPCESKEETPEDKNQEKKEEETKVTPSHINLEVIFQNKELLKELFTLRKKLLNVSGLPDIFNNENIAKLEVLIEAIELF